MKQRTKVIKVGQGQTIRFECAENLNPITFTLAEAGAILQLSPTKTRTLTVNGGLETVRNGSMRVLGNSLLRYLSENPIKKK